MTKTIIDKVQIRVNSSFGKIKEFSETYERVVPALNSEVGDFGAALQGLDELKNILDDIYRGMQTGVGNLQEGTDLLQEIVDGSANNVTIVNRIVDVFMRSDYSILVQALGELDPPLRQEAIKAISPELRRALLQDIIKANEDER